MFEGQAARAFVYLFIFSTALAGCAGPNPPDSAVETGQPSEPISSPHPTITPAAMSERWSCDDPFQAANPRFSTEYWEKTDFCQHSVDYSSIISGGLPPDRIPAIDEPAFETVEQADDWLGGEWPVIIFEHEGDARAYPLAILMFHEIVNDTVAGRPVVLTFCPPCNSVIAFSRIAPDGRELDFGTTGNLRNSDLIMYDRQTESWWQQITGQAIVGIYTGAALELLPYRIVSWDDARAEYPDLLVLSRDTGHDRDYGFNPYAGYDSPSNQKPFLFLGFPDDRLAAVERVATVKLNGAAAAYPFSELRRVQVVNDSVAGTPLVVFWVPGVKSALDSRNLDNSRDVGSSTIYRRELDGQILTFSPIGEGTNRDEQTGSLWNFFGEALEGPLAGSRLPELVSGQHFWFAWAAFESETSIWTREGD